MKTQDKDYLKTLSVRKLREELEEKNKERMKLEVDMYGGGGSVRTYPASQSQGKYGNIKKIKKDIARIKTFLNVKLKQNA